jgi:hypothetical protein
MFIDIETDEQKINLKILYLNLKLLNQDDNLSLGLHTTDEEDKAKSICENGLLIKYRRAMEGTVAPIGKISNLKEEDLNYFYKFNDYTIVVAIPPQFETENIKERNAGGYVPLTEFSKFLHILGLRRKAENDKYEIFFKDDILRIPPEMIVGYYDQNFNFVENPKSKASSEEFIEFGQTMKDDYEKFKKEHEEYYNNGGKIK